MKSVNSSKNRNLVSPVMNLGQSRFYRFISLALSLLVAFLCFSSGIFSIESAAESKDAIEEKYFEDDVSKDDCEIANKIATGLPIRDGFANPGMGSKSGEGTFAPAMIELPQGLKSDTGRIEGIIKTSSEVASVEVNGVKAELAGEKDGVKEWKYTFESSHAGEKTFKVTAYNSAGQKSPEFTMTVTFAQGVTDDSTEPKSFIEKLVAFIRNIMGLIDRLLEGFMVLL